MLTGGLRLAVPRGRSDPDPLRCLILSAGAGGMKKRAKATSNPAKARRRKGITLKGRSAPKALSHRAAPARETELARLTRERDEALEQQKATADILKVISRSTVDLRAVLDTLLQSAVLLCTADMGTIRQRDGDLLRMVTNYGFTREAEQYLADHPAGPLDRRSATGRAVVEGKAIHIPDVQADSEYRPQAVDRYGTVLAVPMLRDGTTIGVFGLGRREVNPL